MKNLSIFILAFGCLLISCSQQAEKSNTNPYLDKIKSGEVDSIDVDKLVASMGDGPGEYAVKVPKAHFKIKFPVLQVKESTTTQIIDDKEVEIVHYTANLQDKNHDNLGYLMDYVFLPEVKTKEDIKALFDDQREYILSAANAKLEFEKVIELNGVPGRHLYLTIDKSDIKTHYKLYFNNGIFYKLAVITEKGKLFNKNINRFFNSFKIID